MKNPITVKTAGLAFATCAGSGSAWVQKGDAVGLGRGQGLAFQNGEGRIKNISSVTTTEVNSVQCMGHASKSMRVSMLNTRRSYPVGRDSREMASAPPRPSATAHHAFRSAGHRASDVTVNQGTIQEHKHTLHELTVQDTSAQEHGPAVFGLEGIEPEKDSLTHSADDIEKEFAAVSANMLHHHVVSGNGAQHFPVDLLHEVTVRAGHNAEGKAGMPAIFVSGGLALAVLSGAAHGVQAADHLLLAKLHTWPGVYQYASQMNDGITAFINHMEASGAGHSARSGLAEMLKHSNIETVVDSEDPSTFRTVKLNLKPVPGGPTLSITLSVADEVSVDDRQLVKPKRKDFSVDVPGGILTLTVPELPPNKTAIVGPRSWPASLGFVEKNSGAEFALAKLDLPYFRR